jgi:tetratricopeptide (TPR) repeat protein
MEGTEEKVLNTALEGLQRVLGEGGAADLTDARDHMMAVARIRLGRIYLGLGRNREAQGAFEEARRLCDDRTGADRRSLLDLAEAYWGLGTALTQQDKRVDAERCLRRAIGLAKDCIAAEPRSQETREVLMTASNELGDLYQEQSLTAAARAPYEYAIELGSATPGGPETLIVRKHLGYAWMKIGELNLADGDFAEGRAGLNRSLELRRALVRETGDSAWASLELAITLRRLGRGEQLAGQAEPARTHLLEALETLERLRTANPRWLRVHRYASNLCCMLGEIAMMQGDDRTARWYYARAPKVLEDVIGRFDSRVLRVVLAECYQELGWVEAASLRPEAVPARVDQALLILEGLIKDEDSEDRPKVSRIIDEVRNQRAHAIEVGRAKGIGNGDGSPTDSTSPDVLLTRAEAEACLGRHAKAADIAGRLAARRTTDAEAWYRLAVIYVRCRSAVTAGRSPAEPSGPDRALQDRYASLATRMLERAIEHGFADRYRLRNDVDLVPLRPYPGFQALIRQFTHSARRDHIPG